MKFWKRINFLKVKLINLDKEQVRKWVKCRKRWSWVYRNWIKLKIRMLMSSEDSMNNKEIKFIEWKMTIIRR